MKTSRAIAKGAIIAATVIVLGFVGWIAWRGITLFVEDRLVRSRYGGSQREWVKSFPQAEIDVRRETAPTGSGSASGHADPAIGRPPWFRMEFEQKGLVTMAEILRRAPSASLLAQGSAAFVLKDYAEAERLALTAAGKAEVQSPVNHRWARAAYCLASNAAEARRSLDDALRHALSAEPHANPFARPYQWTQVQWNIASLLAQTGRPAEALERHRGMVSFNREWCGPRKAITLEAQRRFGRLLFAVGKFSAAEQQFRALLDADEKLPVDRRVPERWRSDLLKIHRDLAIALFRQERYAEAMVEQRRALEAREAAIDSGNSLLWENEILWDIRIDLAASLVELRRYAEAEDLLRRIVDRQSRRNDQDRPKSLESRHQLARALFGLGCIDEAERMLRDVLVARERVLGPEDPSTLKSRAGIGDILEARGRYAEAAEEHRKVLAARERALGPEHPDTLHSLDNLGSTLDADGHHAEAEQLHRRALAASQRVLGAEHPDTLTSRNNLAITLLAQARCAEAEQEHRKVLAARERVLGPDHPSTQQSRSNLANALDDLDRDAEAEQLHRQALAGNERALGPDHPETLFAAYNLALRLSNRNRLDAAYPLAARARARLAKALGEEHPQTKRAAALEEQIRQALDARSTSS